MNTIQESISHGCFSQVFINQGIAVKKFKYTNGHLIRPEILNVGYDDVISISTAEQVIQNEHSIHSYVSNLAKSIGQPGMFPEYIQIPDDKKPYYLLSRAATCDVSKMEMNTLLAETLVDHVAHALALMHWAKIVHGDIKEQNILWDKVNRQFQVADFGCSSTCFTTDKIQRDLMQTAQMIMRICKTLCVSYQPLVEKMIQMYSNCKLVYSMYN